jgi:MoaA/NifB/PqqE/SkfB family radical SAM enzyme
MTLTQSETRDRSRVHYRRFHNIYLYITERCQLRCGHCYMGDRLERGMVMPLEKATQIINYFRRLGGEYITFLGGEPTLHPDLPTMVDVAIEAGYKQVMINSNGLLERTIDRIAPDKLHYISFSLDGASAATHDLIRGEGTYKKTVPCIHRTVEAGYPVRILCTISQKNIHEAEAVLALADEIGVKMVNFHVFSEEGRGVANPEWSLTSQEWISFYEHLERIKDKFKVSIWYPPTYSTSEKLNRYVREGYNGCVGCSLDRLSIFPDGRCYVCSLLFDVDYHFGLYTEAGLTINRSEQNEFEMFTKAAKQAEKPWLTGCPAEAVLTAQGKKEQPDHIISMCRLWKSQA